MLRRSGSLLPAELSGSIYPGDRLDSVDEKPIHEIAIGKWISQLHLAHNPSKYNSTISKHVTFSFTSSHFLDLWFTCWYCRRITHCDPETVELMQDTFAAYADKKSKKAVPLTCSSCKKQSFAIRLPPVWLPSLNHCLLKRNFYYFMNCLKVSKSIQTTIIFNFFYRWDRGNQ